MGHTYFNQLNYSMANEDTTVEFELSRILGAKKILTVGGSGSRSLPFLAHSLDSLTIVDLSPDQLLFIELKLETIKQLTYEDAICFWTEELKEKRESVFNQLNLRSELRDFFKFQSNQNADIPPLYWGKWEKTFRKFSLLTRLFFSKTIRENLFKADNPDSFFNQYIKGLRWNLLLKIVGNKIMFNSLLYRGDFIVKNSPLSYFEYYSQAFERLIKLNIKKSHFLQICFFGKIIYPEALPLEFTPDIFEKIKRSDSIPKFNLGSIFDEETHHYDFVSLSDVPSYLKGEMENNYVQSISKKIETGGVIVNRFYLRTPENTNLNSFSDITESFTELTSNELVQMYQIQILQKKVPHTF